ncbi:hypothetical protein MGYG_05267 [Nannizzia gypsea CBS 118893]|uniref:Uncharacterized protein n=1 Tax=Arthroderma gypseum (strain ATCC MYA-4604 / CBS 118893) TaxID=535722 RepID=E4UVD9_ARTGP|nr:hypothetical protein MGYG_05267 [Nannizzia gypsea CBS 118893]EFR02266.1 hypothetical protein MGYG_05267 [Nannizzia gypsea CBS 118893]
MLRYLPRALRPGVAFCPARRRFHQATGDFINYDAKRVPTSNKVSIIAGEPGESYVLVSTDVGRAFHAASLAQSESTSAGISSEGMGETCKIIFFHDSQHFGVAGFAQMAAASARTLHDELEKLKDM